MENKKRLIDANDLRQNIESQFYWMTINPVSALEEIDNAPTVDAVEVVHGYWDDSGRYQFPSGKKAIRCSVCGCALSEGEYHLFNWNYCPVCGAKMDGERKDNG
jgi:hypothetical protein